MGKTDEDEFLTSYGNSYGTGFQQKNSNCDSIEYLQLQHFSVKRAKVFA